jgi:hypothetical protein
VMQQCLPQAKIGFAVTCPLRIARIRPRHDRFSAVLADP